LGDTFHCVPDVPENTHHKLGKSVLGAPEAPAVAEAEVCTHCLQRSGGRALSEPFPVAESTASTKSVVSKESMP